MIDIVFATNNAHKVEEIKAVVGQQFNIITLQEAGIDIDIPEPHDTLQANASEKSATIFAMTNKNCFSEDTGLEIAALNGAPGVHSARYAGEHRDFQANIDKVLHELSSNNHRKAQFRTVISLIWNQQEYFFEGICTGTISTHQSGNKGFGYDPIFIPDGSNKSFADMTLEEKSQFSHRSKATNLLIQFLKNQTANQ